jgi:phosphoglycerate dehydrogenase-like enzyme
MRGSDRILPGAEVDRRVVLASFDATPEDRELSRELDRFAEVDFREDLEGDRLAEIAGRTEVLVVGGWRGTIGGDEVRGMPRLKFLQTLAAGVNHVPFASLPPSVLVSTGSGASSLEIAEHVFALMLSAAKNVVRHTTAMRRGLFPQGEESRVLSGNVLGILGVGSIGAEVAKLGRCFGMVVHGCDKRNEVQRHVDRLYDLENLHPFLAGLDFLVLSVPLTNETAGMISRSELCAMKPGVVLVNVCRGGVVKEKDLFEYLSTNPDATACLDVWWKYSPDKIFRQNYPFETLENVVMTPHNAAFYPGHHTEMVRAAFGKVLKFLKGEHLEGLANPSEYL